MHRHLNLFYFVVRERRFFLCLCLLYTGNIRYRLMGRDGVAPPEAEAIWFTVRSATIYGISTLNTDREIRTLTLPPWCLRPLCLPFHHVGNSSRMFKALPRRLFAYVMPCQASSGYGTRTRVHSLWGWAGTSSSRIRVIMGFSLISVINYSARHSHVRQLRTRLLRSLVVGTISMASSIFPKSRIVS